jgi:hypothetical protein
MSTETNSALARMMFLDCPACLDGGSTVRCGLPAEVRCRFTMRSADGPVESAMIRCPAGHWFNGSIESLTWESTRAHPPGQAGVAPGARPDCRPGRHEGRAGGGPLAVPDPGEPERQARRPNGAPAYYLGRPARLYITAMRPPRRHAASDHPEHAVTGGGERPLSRHGQPLGGTGAGTARVTPATTSLPVLQAGHRPGSAAASCSLVTGWACG